MKQTEMTPKPTPSRSSSAVIGPTIRVNGDLSGDEDVVVQGQVEGTISLRDNTLLVGKEGQINATVHARVIDVEGKVEGDLNGEEQVVLQRSANVRGNIVAPRVTLEDGCKFKGSIDMDVEAKSKRAGSDKVASLKSAAGGADSSAAGPGSGSP